MASDSNLAVVLDRIAAIKPALQKQAKISDRDNCFPTESLELIKKEGLLNLIIPTSFGGFGLSFLEYQHSIAQLSQACAATAASLNMHCIVLGALADVFSPRLNDDQKKFVWPYAEKIFNKVTQENKVFASATSEPATGARYSKTKTTYHSVAGGYVINGTKSFVTMAGYADFYSVIARKKDAEEGMDSYSLTFFIVPSDAPGVRVVEDWDTLGMRGTQSHQVVFNDVFIPEESAFLGITGFALMKIIQAPHWVTGGYLGVYLGIMEASLNFAINYIKERTDKDNKTGLGYDAMIQANIAKLYQLYQHAYNAVFDAANRVIKDPHKKETHQALYLAKYVVGENAVQLAVLAMKTCGGAAIHKKHDLERYFRDSMCAPLMPVVSNACEAFIGKSLIGLPTDTIW